MGDMALGVPIDAPAVRALLEDAKRYFVKSPAARARLTWPAVNLTPTLDELSGHPGQIRDTRMSRELADVFIPKVRQCYRNAFFALVYSEGLPVTYIEGFAVLDKIVMFHGWLEFAGRIIDPTWAYEGMGDAIYFAGLRVALPEALFLWRDTDVFPFVTFYGRSGLDHPGYSQAFYAALACNQAVFGLGFPRSFRSHRAYYEPFISASRGLG